MRGGCSTAFGLLGLTIGVATLRGPARGAEDGPPSAAKAELPRPSPATRQSPSAALYLREGADGVVVVRPAAAFRHKGLDRVVPLIGAELGREFFRSLAKQLKIDTSRPGFLKLRGQDIEWVTASVSFGKTRQRRTRARHTLHVRLPDGPNGRAVRLAGVPPPVAIRMRRGPRRGPCRTTRSQGRSRRFLGPNPCVFLPDDRTIVFDEEAVIRKIASGEIPEPPAFLRGPAWERASRGLLAIAIKNRGRHVHEALRPGPAG